MVMPYLLDTNAWIHPAREIVVCSVVWAELLHGARKYEKRDERVARIERTLTPYQSLPFDDLAARRYAEIRDEQETRGEVIGPNDLLIASIALVPDLILVTNNREFQSCHRS